MYLSNCFMYNFDSTSSDPILIKGARGQASTDDGTGTKYPLPNTHCATSAPELCQLKGKCMGTP